MIETRDGGYILAGSSNPLRETNARRAKKRDGRNGSIIKSGARKDGGSLQGSTKKANEKINETTETFNEEFDEHVSSLTDKANKSAGSDKNSSLQYGINKPSSPLEKSPTLGESGNDAIGGLMDGISNRQPTLPASGDKKTNYGNRDFWVVKLKDKMKTGYERVTNLEAMPNPTSDYTNVIINYEYEGGTASVVDLSGHVLQQFPITDRTIPIDLSGYPDGIYVVNIKTEVGSDGIKIVKTKK